MEDSTKKRISEEFNNLTFEQRCIAANAELLARINDLERQKNRLKLNYNREVDYVNERIRGYQTSIAETYKMLEKQKTE